MWSNFWQEVRDTPWEKIHSCLVDVQEIYFLIVSLYVLHNAYITYQLFEWV